ncbi:VOC family protein [Erysipelothrix sp. HDW6C]|uniref:VOC family protein n=1 Tax=Erysipelothrix sp. HDW6C TaxID=2714930 RepID=UPI001408D1F5|nr:VOC family protein [Erysipelothrix sp. HDW6C]QIK69109.1 VOC family protein [Erysipelothrix sp. HDW6C]
MLLNDNTKLSHVTLRVQDLENMTQFYTQIIGLKIINKQDDRVMLGVGKQPIVELVHHRDAQLPSEHYTGLYHLAILMPDEKDLGQILYHFSREHYQISGAGDHDYSQALYMNDPEGNGIEIYADRPRETWVIHDDGTIVGGTKAVDVQRLLSLVDKESWSGMPEGTVLGHVHLQLNDIMAARSFYIDTLGYELKTDMGHAIFISKNGYHHDIGANVWAGNNIQKLPSNITGMESFTVQVDNLEAVITAFKENKDYSIISIDKNLIVEDKAGIRIQFTVL